MPRSPELKEFVTAYDITLGDKVFNSALETMAVDHYPLFGVQVIAKNIAFTGNGNPKVFLQHGTLSTDFQDMVDEFATEAALELDAGNTVNIIIIRTNVMPQMRARIIMNNGTAGTITLRLHKLGQGL